MPQDALDDAQAILQDAWIKVKNAGEQNLENARAEWNLLGAMIHLGWS